MSVRAAADLSRLEHPFAFRNGWVSQKRYNASPAEGAHLGPGRGNIFGWLVEHAVDLGSSEEPATHWLVVDRTGRGRPTWTRLRLSLHG